MNDEEPKTGRRVQAQLSFGDHRPYNNGEDSPFGATIWLDELCPHVDIVSPLDNQKRWRFVLEWHATHESDGTELKYIPAFYRFKEES